MQTTRLTTTQLGQTGLEITRVGIGAWLIGGGGWEHGWGRRRTTSRDIAGIHEGLAQLSTPGTVTA